MCVDCSGVTTENYANCVCFLIRYGDSVVLVTLTANLLSIIVDIQWEISKLAVSVNFSNSVTVPVLFHFDGWPTKVVINFVVVAGMVRASSVMTGCGFVVVSHEVVLTCIVKCWKCMVPCVVSVTTLLFLIKCHPIFGPINFFITTKSSAKVLPPVSNLIVAVAKSFSNWPLATFIWKMGGSSSLRILFGAFSFIVSTSFWAIALTNAPESTRASTVRLISISRGTKTISCFRFRTIVEVNGRQTSFVCSSLTNAYQLPVVRGGVVASALRVVTRCCSVFWISVEQSLEQLRNNTGSLPVWFPRGCSVVAT